MGRFTARVSRFTKPARKGAFGQVGSKWLKSVQGRFTLQIKITINQCIKIMNRLNRSYFTLRVIYSSSSRAIGEYVVVVEYADRRSVIVDLSHSFGSFRQRFYHHFTIVLPSPNFRHKKTNRKRLVFLGLFGRHERIKVSIINNWNI